MRRLASQVQCCTRWATQQINYVRRVIYLELVMGCKCQSLYIMDNGKNVCARNHAKISLYKSICPIIIICMKKIIKLFGVLLLLVFISACTCIGLCMCLEFCRNVGRSTFFKWAYVDFSSWGIILITLRKVIAFVSSTSSTIHSYLQHKWGRVLRELRVCSKPTLNNY